MAKVLFALTGASYCTLKEGHRHPANTNRRLTRQVMD